MYKYTTDGPRLHFTTLFFESTFNYQYTWVSVLPEIYF